MVGDLQQRRAAEQQHCRRRQHDLGVEGHFAKIAPAASHIQNDHEADAAHDDKRVGDDIQQHIAAVGYQVGAAAQRVKTRIVKGSDRVENTQPHRLQRHMAAGERRET